jgi:molecular chaperone DnaJ
MDRHINYYEILLLTKEATAKEIKVNYYALSKEFHPDKGGDLNIFKSIAEAYKILSTQRDEYDKKSPYGKDYNESIEDLENNNNDVKTAYNKENYDVFIKRDQLNLIIYIDNNFDGIIEYDRLVYCDECKGGGVDISPIEIKKIGEPSWFMEPYECEYCESSGKIDEKMCLCCFGFGKIGSNKCKKCDGQKRISVVEKIEGVVIDGKDLKIVGKGNFSRDMHGKVGDLWIVNKCI